MFNRITLELSLKPFKQTEEDYIRKVCADIFEQWKPLLKNRKTVAIMMWTSDGSEILDYNGNLDEAFEYCRFIGTANCPLLSEEEPCDTSLHKKKQDYRKNAPVMTYRILRNIVRILKEEGTRALPDTSILVGETMDIGPEFAISEFKYSRHPEICSGSKLDHFGFVDATALLHADQRQYAAYPDGIPEGLPFGTFLGKQSNQFLPDMNFDFLWLSNGLGFSADPWSSTGKVFDGENFHPEQLNNTRQKVFTFWTLFREACPSIPIETRGTNQSVGIDYATDGVPLYDIYHADLNILPPPNSPWAAINGNYGLEIMGHMTRNCELPGNDFMFRYYIHDIWWCNSPWYDRYNGYPNDIYLPMAISRIAQDGTVKSANICNILSVDNSFGNMPDACVYEPLPHLMKAEKDAADEPGPLVWVYPMKRYTTTEDVAMLSEMYYGDHYICDAINEGFPLSCIVSADYFNEHSLKLYQRSTLVSPVPTHELEKHFAEFSKLGGHVIFYGSKQALKMIPDRKGYTKVDQNGSPAAMREAWYSSGYIVDFSKKEEWVKSPVFALVRNNGAFWLSAYNPGNSTQTRLKFPLGAPLMIGMDTEMKDGKACYYFARSEHRECRILIQQENGIISCDEVAPVSGKWRRSIRVSNLKDATVCFLPESYCTQNCSVRFGNECDETPKYDKNFSLVYEKELDLYYYRGEHINGNRIFLMPFPSRM